MTSVRNNSAARITTMPHRTRPALGMLVAALPCIACTGGCNSFFNSWFDPTTVGSFSRETTLDIRTSLSIQDTPTGISGATDPAPEDLIPIYEEYRLGPGDSVNFRIFELLAPLTETVVQATVDEIGTVSLPVLGQIRVAGLTRSEIQQEIVEQLDARGILRDAQVIVEPLVKRNQIYSVFGATPGPNVYPLTRPDIKLLEAVNIAGGLPDSVTDIFVFRNERKVMPAIGMAPRSRRRLRNGKDSDDASVPASLSTGLTGAIGSTLAYGQPEDPQSQPSDLESERQDLLDAMEPLQLHSRAAEPSVATQEADPATAPGAEPETGGADAATQSGKSPTTATASPRWIWVNKEWVLTTEAEEQTTQPADATAPTPHVEPREPPVAPQVGPAEPAIDWDRLAGDRESRIIHVSADALRNGNNRENIIVRNGDAIRLMAGQTGEYYVMGQINRPGAYSITGRQITLKAAIAAAGNLAPLAWPDRCTIYRRYGTREEMHQVNLDAIFAGKESDLLVKNNDLILVGTHPAATFLAVFRNAFRLTYGFGFVYDRNFADIDSFGSKPNPKLTQNTGFGERFPNLFR